MSRKDRLGIVPGTITVDSDALPQITCFEYNKKSVKETNLTVDQFGKMHILPGPYTIHDGTTPIKPDTRLVVIYNYKASALMQIMKEKYEIHSLSLEDITNTDQRSKYDSYDGYELCIINRYGRDGGNTKKRQMSIVLTKNNTVILFIDGAEPEESIQPVLDRIRNDKGRIRDRDAGYTAYALLDVIVDTYFMLLEEIEAEMDTFDDRIASEQSPSMVKELFDLKRETLQVKKNTWPLREMINAMQRDENSLFTKDERNRVFLRDLQDHVYHITESSDNMRDSAYSLVEMHTNFVGMRMNEIMKVLTVITTIFAPIMFIASIYGMNFDGIPEIHLHHGYAMFWGVVAVLSFTQWYYFKKKGWI